MRITDESNQIVTYGIWLETPPYVALRGQGIYQLLVRILKSASADSRIRLIVACAGWTEPEFRKLMNEHGVTEASVELVISRTGIPVLFRLHKRVRTIPPIQFRKPKNAAIGLSQFMDRIALLLGTVSRWRFVVAGIVLAIPFLAMFASLAVIYLPVRLFKEALAFSRHRREQIRAKLSRHVVYRAGIQFAERTKLLFQIASAHIRGLVLDRIMQQEFRRLAKNVEKIRRRSGVVCTDSMVGGMSKTKVAARCGAA